MMRRSVDQTELIAIIAERLSKHFQPIRVIMFGSRARGDGDQESDVDLLVVMPNGVDKRQTAIAMRRALRDLPVAKDVVVTTEHEIAHRGGIIGTVLRPALREGKVIFERG